MENEIVFKDNNITTSEEGTPISREAILSFEKKITDIEGSFVGDTDNCPLKHSFSDGIYVRQITIPEGMIIIGKIHKHDHPNFLLKGKVRMVTEEGEQIIEAPASMISKPGTKRALYAMTELVWTTVHHNPTNTQDLEKLEKIVIAPTYKAYDKFILKEGSIVKKISRSLIKTIAKWHG